MHLSIPFSRSEIERAHEAPATEHMLADAAFEGIRAMYAFQRLYLNPLLQGLLNQNPREQLVVGLHYRIAAHLSSLYKLDAPMHFQAIAASARSLFELCLDMALFSKDSTDESADRLYAFTRVERYRAASKLVDFYSTNPLPPDLNISRQRSLCADPNERAKIDSLVLKYWGRDRKGDLVRPKHWSRFQETRARAQSLGYAWEEWYVRNYHMLSWHIHSGITGVANLPMEAFDYFAMEAFRLSSNAVVESYRILGRELHLVEAMPKWEDSLAFLGQVMGISLIDKRLQSLGEPARFKYLEEHEKGVV